MDRLKIIAKDYNIIEAKSVLRKKFKEMHIVIQQVKSALRTIQTHVKKEHLQKYLNEYFYKLNRSIFRKTIFDNLFRILVNLNIMVGIK